MYSYGPPHMAEQEQDDQLEHTYSSSVRIRDVALKTCQRRWTIGRSGERGSGIFVLVARLDDDDDDDIMLKRDKYWCKYRDRLIVRYELRVQTSNSQSRDTIISIKTAYHRGDFIRVIYRVLFTNPSARAGYDTRSIFKRSLTGFEFRVFLLLD